MAKTKLFSLFSVLFLTAFVCLHQGTKAQYRSFRLPFAFQQELPPKLSRFSLVGALSGMRAVAADWIYIDLLQYYGDRHNSFDGRYRKLHDLIQETIWLDPSFHFGIQYGCAILGWNVERPAEAIDLLKRAIKADPKYPRYQWYLAAITYMQQSAVPQTLGLLEQLVQQPDRSEILLRTLGNLYLKYRMWDKAERYWTWVESVSNDPFTLRTVKASLEKARQHKAYRLRD